MLVDVPGKFSPRLKAEEGVRIFEDWRLCIGHLCSPLAKLSPFDEHNLIFILYFRTTIATTRKLNVSMMKEERKPTTEEKKATGFTLHDMDVLRSLEEDFITASNQNHGDLAARMEWARKSAAASVLFVTVYMTVGVVFFRSQTDWGLPDTILFAIYSATSAGYGHLDIPTSPGFQIFCIVFIMVGIAAMSIMIAQVYQFLVSEAIRAHQRSEENSLAIRNKTQYPALNWIRGALTISKKTTTGRFLSVLVPLAIILLSGALTVGAIEGWTFVECVYFGIASMTTVVRLLKFHLILLRCRKRTKE